MQYLAILFLVLACIWPVISYSQTAPSVILANLYQGSEQLENYWVSEKYDGVRAYWTGSALFTRSGRKIYAPEAWTKDLPDTPLDGELWIDYQQFDRVSGIISQTTPDVEAWKQVKYMVFDLPEHKGDFQSRYRALQAVIDAHQQDHSPAQLVVQRPVPSHQQLAALLNRKVKQGAEGLMLRHIHSQYQSGRSNDLLKLKPYMDAEATVVGHQPGKGKYLGLLGALIVQNEDGQTFKIGTGFSDSERQSPPQTGERISYQYHGLTKNGLPRFASFLRIRPTE
ncbi:DNA ligase [Litoribacillus peritrichatus]|uniref:DNA ligase n=1 Tax=Litoribacillus peritrichatus TaxID=718191 RepID=A0ABP7MPE5_9GAMM